jgi:hypothetical protein
MILRRAFLSVSLALLATAALPQSAIPLDVSGEYTVEGRNIDGSAYSGSLRLTQTGQDVVGEWQIASDSFRGAGPLDGRILTLNWQPGQPPVIYVVMPDGALYGTWAEGKALERALPR